MSDLRYCRHEGQSTYDLVDAQGIYCARVCQLCDATKRATYTPQTFTGYDQSDVDEPIEADDGW